jgi:DNA-binding response OmpR family regulator
MALRAVAAAPPDLILLDIMMPGMNGYEVCAKLKADSATWGIPVLFISALDAAADKVRAFETGGVDYIPKPFQAAEVVARVEAHLQNALLRKILEDRGQALEDREREVRQLRQRVKRLEEVLGYYGVDPVSVAVGGDGAVCAGHDGGHRVGRLFILPQRPAVGAGRCHRIANRDC